MGLLADTGDADRATLLESFPRIILTEGVPKVTVASPSDSWMTEWGVSLSGNWEHTPLADHRAYWDNIVRMATLQNKSFNVLLEQTFSFADAFVDIEQQAMFVHGTREAVFSDAREASLIMRVFASFYSYARRAGDTWLFFARLFI